MLRRYARARRELQSFRLLRLDLEGEKAGDSKAFVEGRNDGYARDRGWLSVGRGSSSRGDCGGGGGVVVLSVVGRVLMQVGCKKFATTPRLGSVQ